MAIVTISDYYANSSANSSSRPAWHHTPLGRQCPNLRSLCPGLSQSFKINTTESRLRHRRIAFSISVALRSIMALVYPFWSVKSAADIPDVILGILFFFATWWNLHLVTEMQGSRMVLGKIFKPYHFDWFMYGMAVVHLGLFAAQIGIMWLGISVFGTRTAGTSVLLAIFLVAWISTWESEEGGLSIA